MIVEKEQVITAVKGLTRRANIKQEHLEIIDQALEYNDYSQEEWEEILNRNNINLALNNKIYTMEMVRLLTLRAIIIPDTIIEYFTWLSEGKKIKNDSIRYSIEFQQQINIIFLNNSLLYLQSQLKQGINFIIHELDKQNKIIQSLEQFISDKNSLWQPCLKDKYNVLITEKELILSKNFQEETLKERQIYLENIKSELADKELELITLEQELKNFEMLYYRLVGQKYAQLDILKAQILEFTKFFYHEDKELENEVKEAWFTAKESYENAYGKEFNYDEFSSGKEHDFAQDSQKRSAWEEKGFVENGKIKQDNLALKELKKIFRKLAKLIHPDLAQDEEEQKYRHDLMTQINQIYEEGDIESLLEILNNWDKHPLSIQEKSIEAKIERINREIALLQKGINKINNQIIELKQSDIYLLKNKVETENEFNRDILQEMSTSMEEEIEELRLELERVKYMCKIAQILESQLKILINPKLYKLKDIQWKGKYCTNVQALCIIMTQYKLNEDENNIIKEYLIYKSEQLVQ